jgi:methylmalonyl-CoA/ethylmalonyl-CoA epimerase
MFERIDHVGIATDDLDGSIELFQAAFGMPLAHRETVSSQGVEAALLDVGEGHIELLRPLGAETVVGRFIERQGPGLHHVAYAVADIDAALEAVKATGLRLIDQQARPGIRGSRVAFLHPRSTAGVLTEIVEPEH